MYLDVTPAGYIMGYNEQWSFIMVFFCFFSIIDISNLLKPFHCVSTGLRSIIYQHICNIINLNDGNMCHINQDL